MSKPWDNETTHTTNEIVRELVGNATFPGRARIEEIERRMRAAERLLEHALQHCGWSFTAQNIERHLEAARKEDGK